VKQNQCVFLGTLEGRSMTVPTSSARWTWLAVALAAAFVAINAVNAVNKGGDAAVFFEGGRRLLNAESLYDGSSAASGFIGPPFQAVFFAPFAAVASASETTARLLWHVTGFACLILGVVFSARTWWLARRELGLPPTPYLPSLFIPLAAVLLPTQTNFEHQNMNPLLLALVAAATWCLVRERDAIAGTLLGTAVALKAFPALVLLVLIARARWRATAIAIVIAAGLTLIPLAIYGVDEYLNLSRDFWRLANSGFPLRGNNQSLVAAFDRWQFGYSVDDVREPAVGALAVIAVTLLVGILLWMAARWQQPPMATTALQMFAALTLAVVMSPIAWDHYWLLLFPALVATYDSRSHRLLGAAGNYLFWAAAVMISGFSPLLIGQQGFNTIRRLSSYTIAALLIFAALVWLCGVIRKEAPR
jgi:hypothetical protein